MESERGPATSGTSFFETQLLSATVRKRARPGMHVPSLLVRRCVVPGSGLDFVVLFGLNLQLAIAPVLGSVGGCVSDVVLAAQFGGNLVEGFSQLVEFVADVDDAAAGL